MVQGFGFPTIRPEPVQANLAAVDCLISRLKPASLIAMANSDHLPMDDLSIFLSVCETGGFRKTAKRLGLSPSTVSEKIALLETRLGAPLLIRTTRSVSLTDVGRSLAERLLPLMRETRAALQDAMSSQDRVRGQLKLNVTGAVMVDILPPLIDRYLVRFPEVRIEVVVEDRLVDITAAGCDAGIRYGEHLAQDMIAVPIGPKFQRLAVAASPGYLDARGIPKHPGDLLAHDCIRLRFSSGALTAWDMECDEQSLTVDPPARVIIGVDAAPAAIELARGGHGIICTFENWLDPLLKTGDLKPVLPQWWITFDGPRLYFSSRLMSAPLRAFVDLVGEERLKGSA
jgi:DNA-binding transcriptional LysR family regulator